jgi:membrane protein implicated in regulation of membrane protease activity
MDAFLPFTDALDNTFLIAAVFGGLLLLVTAVGSLFGGAVDDLAGLGGGGDLQLVSSHTLTAFFTVFGLAGLALHRGSGVGPLASMLGAVAAAVLVMLAVAKLVQMLRGLESSGNLDLAAHAVGCRGEVYLTIPGHGSGQVQIVIAGRFMTLDAVADGPAPIPTGEQVEVIGVAAGDRLIVRQV